MKATELMLKDWVYLSEKAHYAMRVTEIGEDSCLLDFVGNESDPFDGVYGRDGISPISITREILKLNGFEEHENSNFRRYSIKLKGRYSTGGEYLIYDLDNTHHLSVHDLNGIRCCLDIACFDVHELQNILRMLGYEAFADNFKVV